MADRLVAYGVIAILLALLASCTSRIAVSPRTEAEPPADFPGAYYRRLLAQGKPVFRVDSAHSVAVIVVRRGGLLAHSGTITRSPVMTSRVTSRPSEGRADLYVPLDVLAVDEPALRSEARLDTQPSAADIAGTRRNMLVKVLETGEYPYARVAVVEGIADGDARPIRAAVTLHGMTRTEDVSVRVERGAGAILVTGAMAIDQSRFGITPFSLLGGAIAVQDRLNIDFRIRAVRME